MSVRSVAHAWRIAAVALLVVSGGANAGAQTASEPLLRRIELAGGFGFLTGASLGTSDANIRANSTEAQPYRLFTTDSRFGSAGAIEARLSTAVTRRFELEARFAFSRPVLRSSISADVEDAPGLTVVERVDQYVLDGAVLVVLDEMRVGGAVPFASAGAGYLRQLHEGLTVIESGRVYHVGGGLRRPFFVRNRGFVRSLGLRADARLYFLGGGVALDDGPRPHGALSGSFFVTF